MSAQFPRTCRCCETQYTAATWSKLSKCGYVGAYRARGQMYAVELRNCACGSTLGVEVELDVPADAAAQGA